MTQPLESKESLVLFQNIRGVKLRAAVLRLTRHSVFFEIYNPAILFQTSELLQEFQIVYKDRTIYSGRAVLRAIVNTGMITVCEATLEDSWLDLEAEISPGTTGQVRDQLSEFLHDWQKGFRVTPEYKLIIADMQALLTELRLWLDQLELGVRSSPSGDRAKLEEAMLEEVQKPVIPAINALFAKFEDVADKLDPELAPLHRAYMKRQLHSTVLCAPFAYRTFSKPLGYAGDYEMVNMMLRRPYEGGSMFAKLLNLWFWLQAPAEAHRNRIQHLVSRLNQEAARAVDQGRRARVYNLACGPAGEIQNFLATSVLSNHVDFTLVDFNDETIQHANQILSGLKIKHGRTTGLQWIKKSVHQLLKESSKSVKIDGQNEFDFVYCAGLFDYLSDEVCKRLMNLTYEFLAPGGLLLATNVDPSNPMRNGMEHLLDWHLVYRTSRQCEVLRPAGVAGDAFSIKSDLTGVNLFMEARKIKHG